MDIMQEERKNFVYGNPALDIPGCIANGIPEATANAIYDQMIDFAKYAFNKSHAAAYAAVSMQTAYMKAHYPLEFAAGLLTSVMDKTEKLVAYRDEYEKKGLRLQKPDINLSGKNFTAVGDEIIFGLASIKNVGGGDVEKIIEEREKNGPFLSFSDFMKRCYAFNTRTIEFLIKAGAFDSVGAEKPLSRRAMIDAVKPTAKIYKAQAKHKADGQMSIFDLMSSPEERRKLEEVDIKNAPEYDKKDLYKFEKEATGFYISGSPLDEYRKHMAAHNAVPLISLNPENPKINEIIAQRNITIAGLITEVKHVLTKKDKKPMAIVTLDDGTEELQIPFFPKSYEKFSHLLFEDAPIICRTGIKSDPERGISFFVNDAISMDDSVSNLWIAVATEREVFRGATRQNLIQTTYRFRGGLGDLIVMSRDTRRVFVFSHGIFTNDGMERELEKVFGPGNVSVSMNKFRLMM